MDHVIGMEAVVCMEFFVHDAHPNCICTHYLNTLILSYSLRTLGTTVYNSAMWLNACLPPGVPYANEEQLVPLALASYLALSLHNLINNLAIVSSCTRYLSYCNQNPPAHGNHHEHW
jgi:hypothetical protein